MSDINNNEEIKKEEKVEEKEKKAIDSPFKDMEIDESLLLSPYELEEVPEEKKEEIKSPFKQTKNNIDASGLEELDEQKPDSLDSPKNKNEKITSPFANSDIETEISNNEKELENLVNNSSSFTLDNDEKKEEKENFPPPPTFLSGGVKPISINIPKASDNLNEKEEEEKNKEKNEEKPKESLVPKYDLFLNPDLINPFKEEDLEIIKSKKLIYVSTGNADDVALKKDNLDALVGKKKITYKKAVPFMQRHKVLVRAFGIIIAMMIITFSGAIVFKKQIAEQILSKKISSNNFPIKSFKVIEFNSKFIELSDIISSDNSWSMKSFKMNYENGGISLGQIESINIKGFESKYTTIFDLLQGPGLRNLTNGNNLNIARLNADGVTDFGFAKISFSTKNTTVRNNKIRSSLPISVSSDLINFKGKIEFSGNYDEADLLVELSEGQLKKFHNVETSLKSGLFTFKKSKKGIDLVEIKVEGDTNDDSGISFNAKSVPSEKGGIDIVSDIKLELKKSKEDRFTSLIKAEAKSAMLSGSPFQFKGKLPLNLKISNLRNEFFDLSNINTYFDGEISCIKEKCSFTLKKPSSLAIDSIIVKNAKNRIGFEESVTTFNIMPDNNSPLFDVKDDGNIEYSFNISDTLLKGSYTSGFIIKPIEMNPGLVSIKGSFNPETVSSEINVMSDGGYYSDNLLGIAGLRASVFIKSDLYPAIKISGDEIHFLGKETLVPVFTGEADLNPIFTGYDFKILLQSLRRDLLVDIKGEYNLTDDTGKYSLKIPKIEFADGGAQLSNISPYFAKYIARLNGALTINGSGIINNGDFNGVTKILIENASFNWGAVKFNNLNGAVGFKSFYPIITDEEQTLYASMIDIGYPVYDNILGFRITGNNRIIVDEISSTIANGSINLVEKSFIPFNLSGGVLNTEIKGMDLNDLTKSLKMSGLSINGKADGKAQFYISRGFVYTDSTIETTDKGLLKYVFDDFMFDNEELKEQLKPLSDFNYDRIVAKIKGRPSTNNNEAYTIDLELEGINPEIHKDGIGTLLKIDLQSNLGELVKLKPILNPVPDKVSKQMEAF